MYRRISLSLKALPLRVVPFFAPPASAAIPRGGSNPDAGTLHRAMRGVRLPTEPGATLALDQSSLAVCLGTAATFDPARLRVVAAQLGRALVKMGASGATIEGTHSWDRDSHQRHSLGAALAEGLLLGTWRFDTLDGSASQRKPRLAELKVHIADRAAREGFARGLAIGDGVNHARHIAATPPNVAHPSWIAAEARRIGRSHGLKVRVLDHRQAEKLGMGGLIAVGKGSAIKPCLVVMEWSPRGRSRVAAAEHVVLVGKTITYDTGGYSLKVNNGMKGMKYDKCGGAAVLGAMRTIAALKVPIRVTGVLAVAENMVSESSYRPDDIITMNNGITVEVTNTDAEGRLVLADALSYACTTLKPTAIVDIATLTGGVGVALGHFCAGYFCENADLAGTLEAASAATGERVWRLPLWDPHREFMRSQHADIINSNPLRTAHPIQGAAFLSYFVDPKVPWAHLDIAAMAVSEGANDLTGAGPTGYGVRLLVELVAARTHGRATTSRRR